MFLGLSSGAEPLTPLVGPDGLCFLHAHLQDAGTTAVLRAVELTYKVIGGEVQWAASATFGAGARFGVFGVTIGSGKQNDVVPCAIHGAVSGVTLPAAVTRTNTDSALVRGGTRAALTAALAAGLPSADLAVAEITDTKVGAQNARDLYLFGGDYLRLTLYRSLGRIRDFDGLPSQSLLTDSYGGMFLDVDAALGLTRGRLTQLRRGRTGTWRAVYGGGGAPALADAVAGGVIVYGVPTYSVTAAANAVGSVQVAGWVDVDLGAAVNVPSGGAIGHIAGGALGPVTTTAHLRAVAIPEASGNLRTRRAALLGRVFYG